MRGVDLRHFLRRSRGDDFAAAGAAFGAEVDDPVGGLHDVQIVFDHHHRVALVAQPMQHVEQLGDVVEVQASGGFVEDVEGLAGAALGEFAGELHALRLAAGERRRALAQADVGKADVQQGVELALQHRHRVEERAGLLDGHVQHFVDVLALVAHFQGLAVVALALADVARHVDVRQEVHLHLDDAVALAGLAAPALHVEAEPPRPIAPRPRLLGLREQFADGREEAGVGGRIGTRGAPDGALVDVHHLVEVFETVYRLVAARRHGGGAVQGAGGNRIQGVVDEGGLAGTGDAGDAGEQPGRHIDGDVLEIVAARLHQAQRALGVEGRALGGHGDGLLAGEVLPGDGLGALQHVVERPGDDDLAAVYPGAGADVHHVVGGADRFFVVLHHEHRVADVAQVGERAQQARVVALMQAD